MKWTRTSRGFLIGLFTDAFGAQCSLQKSSATSPLVWLGVNVAHPKILAVDAAANGVATRETRGWVDYPLPVAVEIPTRMHLSRDQVAALLPALQRFVETGELL